MLTAGDLPHRVTFQERTETSDGHDGVDESWDAVPTLRPRMSARVKPLLGRDLERARQVDPRISYEIWTRYWRAFRTDLRGGRTRVLHHVSSSSADDVTIELVGPPVDEDSAHVKLVMMGRSVA